MRFEQILDKYREISSSSRDVGDRFERLMHAYLRTDPRYASKFKEIWLWNEFPYRIDFGFTDTGIDLVAVTHEGDHWAIQCKCYQEDTLIDKPAVDTFPFHIKQRVQRRKPPNHSYCPPTVDLNHQSLGKQRHSGDKKSKPARHANQSLRLS